MSVREIGITVVRHQEPKGGTLRLHLWYPKGHPIEPELIAALRGWELVRPLDNSRRSAVGQLSPSRIFIDIARADELRPPYRRRNRGNNSHLTPSELRRLVAISDRLWKLELWLVRWFIHTDKQDDKYKDSSLVITHYYPEYVVRRIAPFQRHASTS
jgi:hypothetical protein